MTITKELLEALKNMQRATQTTDLHFMAKASQQCASVIAKAESAVSEPVKPVAWRFQDPKDGHWLYVTHIVDLSKKYWRLKNEVFEPLYTTPPAEAKREQRINVGTIGHIDAKKSTLASTIHQALAHNIQEKEKREPLSDAELAGVEMPEPVGAVYTINGLSHCTLTKAVNDTDLFTLDQCREAVAAAVARERKACAELVETLAVDLAKSQDYAKFEYLLREKAEAERDQLKKALAEATPRHQWS